MSSLVRALPAVVALFLAGCAASPAGPATVTVPTDATRGGDSPVAAATRDAGDPGPIPVSSEDPQWGSPKAFVTIVEFADFQCPYSRKAAATLLSLRQKYGADQLRIVWKNDPLPFHKLARGAHEAAFAAFAKKGDAGFWAFFDAVYGTDKAFSDDLYLDAMRAAGVTPAEVEAARTKATAKIDGDIALGGRIGVTGTPHFFVNGIHLSGAQPFEKFVETIDPELARARAAAERGAPREIIYAARTTANFAAPPPPPPAKPTEVDDTTVWAVPVGGSPVRGKATALVTIVEFGDYQCPYCVKAEATIAQLLRDYGDKVRLVYKDNPLPFHPHAEPAAEVAIEVRTRKGDGAFWRFHDALYASQNHLDDSDLADAAAAVGLDKALALGAIQSKKHKKVLDESSSLAEDVGAQGTPTFFVNGKKLVGAQPIEKFKALVDQELAKAEAMVKQGTPAARVYDEIVKTGASAPALPTVKVPPPTSASPSHGPANARVVVQYFGDFQCPFCKRVEATLADLDKEFPGQIRFVWRNLPLPMHKNAQLAAEAAMEAFAQKGGAGFWQYHDELMADPQATDRAGLEKAAARIGLDMKRFGAALDSRKHQAAVDAEAQLAAAADIHGTPAFEINGYYVTGAQSLSKFRKVVVAVLKAPPKKP